MRVICAAVAALLVTTAVPAQADTPNRPQLAAAVKAEQRNETKL